MHNLAHTDRSYLPCRKAETSVYCYDHILFIDIRGGVPFPMLEDPMSKTGPYLFGIFRAIFSLSANYTKGDVRDPVPL